MAQLKQINFATQVFDPVVLRESIKRMLARSMDSIPVDVIMADLIKGEAGLYEVADKGARKALFIFYKNVDSLHVMGLDGQDFMQWAAEIEPDLENIARDLQCNRITLEGRPGWQRWLAQFGYKTRHIVMSKEL